MLEISDLTKIYGLTHALTGATISFSSGSIHAVLGENGSGKSTMVKLLSGILPPTKGEVSFQGKSVRTFSPSAFQRLGLATVFQEVLIAADRSVTENVLLGLDGLLRRAVPRGERKRRAQEVLARISIASVDLDAPAGTMPLAVQQSIVLARALVRKPRVLILDEVTAALDFADREAVFTTLEAFARAGGLIIFISHRMDEVMRLADKVSILRSGKLVGTLDRANVTPRELLELMAPVAAKELAHAH